MKNKQKILIAIIFFIAIIVSFIIGILIGQKNQTKTDLLVTTYGQTIYATINEIKENNGTTRIFVKGLEINDANWRGEYFFSIKKDTIMTWRGENLDVSDFDVGDKISITFTDETIKDIFPTPLEQVKRIQLLEDER